MEKTIDEKITIETVTISSAIDDATNKTEPYKVLKTEDLSLIIKQKKRPCAGCDGICCTKPAKEQDDGHHHSH